MIFASKCNYKRLVVRFHWVTKQ